MDLAVLTQENAALKALLEQTQAALADHQAALAESEEARRRLESIVSELRREKFSSKSESCVPISTLAAGRRGDRPGHAGCRPGKAEAIIKGKSGSKTRQRTRNRGHLPPHLPRVEQVIEPESTLCPCGCGEMARIGEDVSERLDIIPAQFRVLVTRRPKYACRRCSGAVVQAHAPEHVVPGEFPTEALIAQVIVSKFGDHLPFYRQADIYTQQGSSSTGPPWVTGRAGPASISSRSPTTWATIWPKQRACSWTRPPLRCSIPGDDNQKRLLLGDRLG